MKWEQQIAFAEEKMIAMAIGSEGTLAPSAIVFSSVQSFEIEFPYPQIHVWSIELFSKMLRARFGGSKGIITFVSVMKTHCEPGVNNHCSFLAAKDHVSTEEYCQMMTEHVQHGTYYCSFKINRKEGKVSSLEKVSGLTCPIGEQLFANILTRKAA